MLEQAAGCLETAGQGFWRNCNGFLRSKKTLDSGFWKQRTYEATWQVILHNVGKPHHYRRSRQGACSSQRVHDPFLDFLYPDKCLLAVDSWLSKRRKENRYHGRRRIVASFSKPYSPRVPCLLSWRHDAAARINIPRFLRPVHTTQATISKPVVKESLLDKLLDETTQEDNDRIWELWENSAQEPQLRFHLMAYLSTSKRPVDIDRAVSLLRTIDPDKRTTDDYEVIFNPLLSAGHLSTVELVCEDALAQGTKIDAWVIALSISMKTMKWEDVLRFWRRSHDSISFQSLSSLAAFGNLPQHVLLLLDYMKDHTDLTSNHTDAQLASYLLDVVFKSSTLMRDISVETILSLTQEFNSVGLLTSGHYKHAIETSLGIGTRFSKTTALILYRNCRWHLPTAKASRAILHKLLETRASLETYHGVQYLLDEFTRLYKQPTTEAYKIALTAFSRSGDVPKVKETFEKLVSCYGAPSPNPEHPRIPRSLKWVVPVLYAYARLGDYAAAENEFYKLVPIYRRLPTTVCWNVLILAHANAHRTKPALRVFRRMQKKGKNPDAYTFSILMGLFARSGDIESTLALCQMAEKANVRMHTSLMHAVVDVYCRNQRLKEAEEVAESTLSFALEGSHVWIWNRLLWAYAFRADLDSVSRIHNRMKESGIEFDGMTYAALLLCFSITGRPASARRLLRGLQRSRRIHATEFHYTIVLYGFIKQGNRDMTYLIYREMEERFHNPGLSARVLMLRSELGKDTLQAFGSNDEDPDYRLSLSEDLLFKAIFDFDRRQFASKYPRPGTNRLPLREAFPSLYYEPILKAYGAEGIHRRNEQLLNEYMKGIQSATVSGQSTVLPSLRFLGVLMEVYLNAETLEPVLECWKMALQRASQTSREVDVTNLTADLSESLPQMPPATEPTTTSEKGQVTKGPSYLQPSTIPAQRFILSRHFSLYMRAIAESGQRSLLPDLVKSYQERGYSMTSGNWLTYVRSLAASSNVSEQLNAFATFERIFMPAFPGWRRLRRGIQLRPKGTPYTLDLLDNRPLGLYTDTLGKAGSRLWSKVDPTWMQPTYNVLVYLAAALNDFRHRSLSEGRGQLDELFAVAPRTLEAIGSMPHLREKFQGVLLRDRVEQVDPSKGRRTQYVWTGGVLGVDGEKRPFLRRPVDHAQYEAEETGIESDSSQPSASPAQDLPPQATTAEENAHDDADIDSAERLQAPEDEHDIEIETLLERRRREFGIDPVKDEESRDKGE